MGGNGVTNIPGVSGGSGVSDGTGVAGVGGTQTLGLNFLSGALDPRISFTRATTATITDFEGLVKKVKSGEVRFDGMRRVENLLPYSQAIGGTGWVLNSTTATLNNTVAPDGTTTASLITLTGSTNLQTYSPTATLTGQITSSCYIKAGSITWMQFFYGGANSEYANFNVSNGVLGNYSGTASITSVGNGWYRCTHTFTPSTSMVYFAIITVGSGTSLRAELGVATSGTWYLWGAQLENVTGQTNQNPSEYISTNVLSYPYQGAGVDGVQYFPYTNPNCVINGAITTVPTVSINSSNSKFAYNCASAGDYFSTPSSTANRITGNLSLLVQVAMDTWTPATTTQCLVVKDGVSAGTRSWAFTIPTTGVLRLNVSFNGSTITSYDSTATTGFANGTVHYVGVQRESSTGIIRFYTSENGTTFTQLGADVVGTAGALFDATTQPVQFGNLSGLSFALDGKIYDSHVYNGLKFTGTSAMVMDFDPSNWTSGTTFTGLETGEVWTLNGSAKIYQGLWDAVGPSSLLIEEQRTNVFLNSTAPATQSFTTTASPYTISFYGSGSITLSGSFVAVVTGSNALTRTTLTFTPTALPLVMTVAGTITKPQLELGSFATSYIETPGGSQVIRNADQASITGTNFSRWYNQSQGSLYAEGQSANLEGHLVCISDGTLSSLIRLGVTAGNLLSNITSSGVGASVFSSISGSLYNKTALASNITTITTVFNGILQTPSANHPTMPTVDRLTIGNITIATTAYNLNGHIRKINYYSTALPASVLQSLTL